MKNVPSLSCWHWILKWILVIVQSSWSRDKGQKVEPLAVYGWSNHQMVRSFSLCAPEPEKMTKNKVEPILWDILYSKSKSRVTECVCFYLILNSNSPTYPIPILGCYARNAVEIQDWSFSFIKFTFELPLKMIFHSTDLAEIYSRSRIKT